MRKFTLEIELENEAFQNPEIFNPGDRLYEGEEIRAILIRFLQKANQQGMDFFVVNQRGKLLDTNGNTCGEWRIETCESSTTDVKEPTSTKPGRKK